jgi:hypothetical protein
MAQSPLRADPKARIQFETLLSGIFFRFVKLPTGGTDRKTDSALRVVPSPSRTEVRAGLPRRCAEGTV